MTEIENVVLGLRHDGHDRTADLIERLQAQLVEFEKDRELFIKNMDKDTAEIEFLNEKLEAAEAKLAEAPK